MSLLFSVIFWTGFRLYKSRHVLKVAAKGAAASARFVMKALWVQKHKYHVKWNDQQVVKCKYKFVVLVVHMWLQHIQSWNNCPGLMNCFIYLLFYARFWNCCRARCTYKTCCIGTSVIAMGCYCEVAVLRNGELSSTAIYMDMRTSAWGVSVDTVLELLNVLAALWFVSQACPLVLVILVKITLWFVWSRSTSSDVVTILNVEI